VGTMTSEFDVVQQAIASSDAPGQTLMDQPRQRQRDLFFHLPDSLRDSVLKDLSLDQLVAFVRRLDQDEVADVLALVSEDQQKQVLEQMERHRREKIQFLLDFEPESAAGLMKTNYVTLGHQRTLADAAERVRAYKTKTGRFPTILVTNGEDRLQGYLPGQALGLAERNETPIVEFVDEIPMFRADSSDNTVVDYFETHPVDRAVVVDESDEILGLIYAEDLLQLIEEKAGETLYEFTGVQEQESILDGPLIKIKNRYLWLILNLGTAFLAAATVGLFEETIAAFALLAVYMPVVAGMGGNAGTQSMAVTVRGISLQQITLSSGARAIGYEMIAGAANGAINGLLVALIASFFNSSPLLGLVLGVSMVLNLIIAGFFGTLIPLILDRFGKDPATSATIFITTATDVLGFFVFLGLAKWILIG